MESRVGAGGVRRASPYDQSSPMNFQKEGRGSLLNGAIQLNDRQLKILEARKANKSHRLQEQSILSPNMPLTHLQEGKHRLPTASTNLKVGLDGRKQKTASSHTLDSSGTADEYWAQEPTNTVETVPTTWSESAESAVGSTTSSSNDSFRNSAKQFYGQRLSAKEKKLYDDTGASWNDSRTEVSASTAAMSKASSNAPSDEGSRISAASRKSQLSIASNSPRKHHLQGQNPSNARKYDTTSEKSVTLVESNSLAESFDYTQRKGIQGQDSMTLKTEPDSEEESLMPLQSRSESLADVDPHHPSPVNNPVSIQAGTLANQSKYKPPRFQKKEKPKSFSEKLRSKLFKNRDPKKTAEIGDHLVRNLMTNSPLIHPNGTASTIAKSPKHVMTDEMNAETNMEESARGSDTGSKSRLSMLKAIRSPRSSSSGSSISQEDKMVMRRFASKTSKNPRRENLVKSGSMKMKQMFSSKASGMNLSPKSCAEEETATEKGLPSAIPIEDKETQDTEASEMLDKFDPSVLPNSPYKPAASRTIRGRRSSVRMRMVAHQVMNDLMEENVIPESDEEDEGEEDDIDDQPPSIQKARSIRSLPDIVKDDEIEIKISMSTEDESTSHSSSVGLGQKTAPCATSVQSPAPREVAHATQRALDEIYNEEPEGYNEFVSRLKSELAGSHTKLFDQFHSMVRTDGSKPKPLSMYPTGLDLKTKETITTMTSHAKGIVGVDCMTGSQISSDKDLEKMKHSKVSYGKQLLKQSNVGTVLTSPHSLQPINITGEYDTLENQSAHEANVDVFPSPTSSDNGSHSMAFEVTLSQHIRKSAVPSPPSASELSTCLSTKSALTKNQTEVSGHSDAATNDSLFDGVLATRVSKPSKAISPKMFVPPSEKVSIPWNTVKLRSVSEKCRDGTDDENIPASWAKVKLRPVEKEIVKVNSIDTSADSCEHVEFHRIVLRKTPTNASTPQNNLGLSLAPSASTDVSGTETKPIDIEKNGKNAAQPIKLTETRGTGERPIKIEDKSSGTELNPIKLANESSVMISLADEVPGSGTEKKLLMNKRGLMKVEAVPGETKANVLWRLDREEVKSALMNMSALSVKLIVSSGDQHHKDLTFPSSDQCKEFANALHDLLHGSSEGSCDMNKNEEDDPSTNSKSSVYIEQLSADEQKVLEEFRQRKKSKNDAKAIVSSDFLKISAGVMSDKLPIIVNTSFTGPSSPLSEVSGSLSLFSVKQTNSMDSYTKMLRMKVPIEAVRHKMMKDGIDPQTIESFLAEKSNSDCPNPKWLTPGEEKIAEQYRQMLRMGVPAEGVRNKMQKDDISSKIIACVIENQPETTSAPINAAPSLSIVEEAVAETYRKMLKMMIPKEAVQHRMIKDGVDPKIMAIVIGKPPEQPKPNSNLGSTNNKLSDAEESIASSYRKMLKLSIPKEAVRHKMTQEGVSEKIITAVLGANPSKAVEPKNTQKRGLKPGFHWNPIADDESIAGSVWSKAKPMSDVGTQKPEAIIDITKHIEMFQKQPEATKEKRKPVKSGSEAKEMAKLIDLNRANNVAITLKAFNDFSHSELAQIIEFLDPKGKVKGDRALFMKDLLPTAAEIKAIKSYEGGDEKLVTAEKWFKQISHIKRIEDKIEVMRTMETFKMDAVVLGRSFQLLTKVCNQVMDSDRLPDLLDMVRQIGNTMNEGRGEAAAGFKLDFLPRLAQTKGSDKKTTALDLVVMLFHVRNQREALMLSTEIPDCQEASRIQLSDLMTDVRTLEASLRKCKKELDQLQKERESSQSGKPPPARGPILSDSRSDTALDPAPNARVGREDQDIQTDVLGGSMSQDRSTFLASMLKDRQNSLSTPAPSVGEMLSAVQKSSIHAKNPVSPRSSLIACIQERDLEEFEFSLDASIRRLEKFVSESSYVVLPKLEAEREEAIEACRDLASFFCESGGERAASNLLKILDEFASGIDRAVTKYDQQQKAETRKKASQKRKSLTSSRPPAPEARSSGNRPIYAEEKSRPLNETKSKFSHLESPEDSDKKSLVLMVNEMLKMAGDKQVKDFMKGIVYDNPDDRMKKIYELEKERKQDFFAARREMMCAITAKADSTECKDSKKASSALLDNGSRDEADDTLSELRASGNNRRKSRIADRWTRKVDGDSCADTNNENDRLAGNADSEILSSVSEESEDKKQRRKKRQSYMERWASRTPVSEASTLDLDAESDVGAFEEMLHKQRQRYIDRWSRKARDDDEIVE
ncbi:formin homology 2 domain containing protein [Nitzschia inconspicua]|uniref:Formin homology 2 domain containing protein n=1 Tax=Nitzschia inconspicua TaxID=303405 RepID=A0A9K3P8X9_9STRA|nr:formin homology 2 domain containing protein [Nitzschia inconspicua]KAG7359496.1 formin homology 2 domain containing protein [Nitzschia inconspicua]